MSVEVADPQRVPGSKLPAVFQAAWFFTRPVSYFESATRNYGPVAWLSLPGFGRVVSVTDPALIKQVFLDHDRAYAGEASKVMGPVLGPHSVLLLDGGEHMRQRKLLLPPFHGEALRAYERRIAEITRREIATWPANRPFAMRPRMQAITLQVILEVIFGVDDAERRDRYSHAVDRLMAISNLLALDTRPGSGRRSPIQRLIARRRVAVDRLIFEDVERRRKQAAGGEDVLSLLLAARDEDGRALTDSELRDELVTLLFAGHETTATALAWAVDLLMWKSSGRPGGSSSSLSSSASGRSPPACGCGRR
ncbi:MAG: cytochrome P450 [Actinobacteria bacterium]|nr:cytochrome P450 [Actinomycetota bacterium]